MNGLPFTARGFMWLVKKASEVTLLVRRGQRTLTFTMKPVPVPDVISVHFEGTPEQAARLEAWFAPSRAGAKSKNTFEKGQAVPLEHYDNFHGIEAIL